MEADVVLVGAGLAGLTAARRLVEDGREVVLVDKGRRAGGRCATRRLGAATVDTGAQFFTVRSEGFARLVEQWTAEGAPIRVWSDGFAQAPTITAGPGSATTDGDGHPRYSVTGGMNRLAAHLATGLDLRTQTRATGVRAGDGAWTVTTLDGTFEAGSVLLTPPVPQALALAANGDVELEDGLVAGLRGQGYEPCLVLQLALDRDPELPGPGGVQFAEGPVAWLGDNAAKGASAVPSLTVHASGDWSESFYDADEALVTHELLALARPWLGGAEPVETAVFRWRYSKPRHPAGAGAVLLATQPGPLVLAGDALAGAKVEGAVISGLAAAALL